MREIKFRAFDKHTRKPTKLAVNQVSTEATDCLVLGQDTVILSQYTGLRDVNGKEIYEGDIVIKHSYNGFKVSDKVDVHTIKAVEWGEHQNGTGFNLAVRRRNSEVTEPIMKWEVIGNIYENPELLNNN